YHRSKEGAEMASNNDIRRPVFLLGRGRIQEITWVQSRKSRSRHTTVIDIVDPPLDPVIRSSVHRGRVVHHVGNVAFPARATVEHVGALAPNVDEQLRRVIKEAIVDGMTVAEVLAELRAARQPAPCSAN